MNWLILKPEQIESDGQTVIRGEQFFSLKEQVDLVVGGSVAVGIFGHNLGRGLIQEVASDSVKLRLELDIKPPDRLPVSLIISVPRPQTVKKILQLSASVGISATHFIKSGNVVPSYLQSKSLFPENIEREMWKALEQVGDTHLPEVKIWQNWGKLREVLEARITSRITPSSNPPILLVADPRAEKGISIGNIGILSLEQEIYLAIGPESGWDEQDLSVLYTLGFKALNLGRRIQRVEIAAALCLGQLSLIKRAVKP